MTHTGSPTTGHMTPTTTRTRNGGSRAIHPSRPGRPGGRDGVLWTDPREGPLEPTRLGDETSSNPRVERTEPLLKDSRDLRRGLLWGGVRRSLVGRNGSDNRDPLNWDNGVSPRRVEPPARRDRDSPTSVSGTTPTGTGRTGSRRTSDTGSSWTTQGTTPPSGGPISLWRSKPCGCYTGIFDGDQQERGLESSTYTPQGETCESRGVETQEFTPETPGSLEHTGRGPPTLRNSVV